MKVTVYQKTCIRYLKNGQFAPTINLQKVERAVAHAMNCSSLDNTLNTPDFELGKKLGADVLSHLLGVSGPQLVDQMTEEEQKEVFGEPNRGELDYSDVPGYKEGEIIK